jgi:type II secretory pathway predicted ATPase ExeA
VEHLQHFGLAQDPFENEPDLHAYFESGAHRSAQRRVERGVRQGKGLTLLVGAVGTGKTLLTRRILEGLEEEMFEVTLMVMVKGAADSTSVLARFARQIGVAEVAQERSALLAQLYEQLAVIREDGRHGVLIVDDAHVMSADALAEVGGLLNLEYEDRRLVSLVLVGLPELELALGRDAALGQRVDVRVLLEGLSPEDTAAYLAHRIERVGGNPALLTRDAVAALHKYGRGRPRLMNTLADNALFEAFDAGRPAVLASDVERAAQDLAIGAEPGSTFVNLGAAGRGGAARANGAFPGLEPDDAPGDLGSLLDSPPSLGEEEPEAVSHLELEDAMEPPADEADSLLAALDSPTRTAPPSRPSGSKRSPAAAPRPARARPAPADAGGDDEIDDLFAELLDE